MYKGECPFLERTSLEWIYIGPVLLLLATNAFILISIFYVVVTKLRSSGQGEPADHQNWKAAKALLVIIPLLGITYLITILGKKRKNTCLTHLKPSFQVPQTRPLCNIQCLSISELSSCPPRASPSLSPTASWIRRWRAYSSIALRDGGFGGNWYKKRKTGLICYLL